MLSFCRSVLTAAYIVATAILLAEAGLYSSNLQVRAASLDERPSLEHMLARMMAYRRWQDNALREYEARRRFQASNPRFNMNSLLEVQTTFRWPYSMQSTVIKQEGSDFIREHVFEKILQAEADLAANDEADVIPKNYDFTLAGKEDCEGRPCWRLTLKPKRKDKYLLDGDAWLDAADYAISHVHGVPSKHVSVWVSRVDIDRHLTRIDGVWLTDKLECTSNIHLVGDVQVKIEYKYDSVTVSR